MLILSLSTIRQHGSVRVPMVSGRNGNPKSECFVQPLLLTRLFEFFRCPSERHQEAAQSVLREQESLLPTLQPRFYPEEEHDAASTPRVRHGAQVSVPVLRQTLEIHAEHLRAYPKVSSRSSLVLQTVVLSNCWTINWCNGSSHLFFVRLRSSHLELFVTQKIQKINNAFVWEFNKIPGSYRPVFDPTSTMK